MSVNEIEKSKPHILIEIIEYVDNSIIIRTIIHKSTGNVSVVAIDTGEEMSEKISPFDTFIQVIDGVAEILINEASTILRTGEAIIIPAHTPNRVKANQRFKMISTVIKSGYDSMVI